MVNAVSNVPFYSYANLLNPTLSSPSSTTNFPDPSTALASDSLSLANALTAPDAGNTTLSSATDSLSSPQLPADVVALLQQFLSPGTSNPAAALLNSTSSDPLTALLDVSSYNGVLNAAYASAPQTQQQNANPVQSVLTNYEAAINAYNTANSAAVGKNIQAMLGTTA